MTGNYLLSSVCLVLLNFFFSLLGQLKKQIQTGKYLLDKILCFVVRLVLQIQTGKCLLGDIFFVFLDLIRLDVFFDAKVFIHLLELLFGRFSVKTEAKAVYNVDTAMIARPVSFCDRVQGNPVISFDGVLNILAQKVTAVVIEEKLELTVDITSVCASVDVAIAL